MKFAWIDQYKDDCPVKMMCRALKASRSGYYAWRDRRPSATVRRRAALTEQVRRVYDEHYQTRHQAMQSIFEYIELFHNRQRRHSSLGYVSPTELETT